MPIYSYRCKKCGVVFDLLVGVNQEEAVFRCPKCNSSRIEKLLVGFRIASNRKENFGSPSSCSSCSGGDCSTCSG